MLLKLVTIGTRLACGYVIAQEAVRSWLADTSLSTRETYDQSVSILDLRLATLLDDVRRVFNKSRRARVLLANGVEPRVLRVCRSERHDPATRSSV